MPKQQNRPKSKSHGLHQTNDIRVSKHQHNHQNQQQKQQQHRMNDKKNTINKNNFENELLNLKERQSGASGRNKAKKSLVSNIVIHAPILPINITTIEKSKSIIDALLIHEESSEKIESKNIGMNERKRHSQNIYAVLDEEEGKLNITLQPSILQFGRHHNYNDDEEIDPEI